MKSVLGVCFVVSLLAAPALAAPTAREREAEAEMVKAKQAMQRELYEVAVGHLLVARSLVPDASGPYLNLGIAYSHLGRCADALPMIEEYLRRKPKSPQASAAATVARCKTATQATQATQSTQATRDDARPAVAPAVAPVAPAPPPPARPAAVALSAPTTTTTMTAPASATDATSHGISSHTTAALSGSDTAALPSLAWLTIHIDPVAANVTLDGHNVGDGIRVFERALPGGVYNLSIVRSGYARLTRQIRLDPGQQLYQTLRLHKQVWPIVVGVVAGLLGTAAIAAVLWLELKPASTPHSTNASLVPGIHFPTGSL